MVYFAVRYRRSKHPHAESIEGNLALEIIWTVLPTILVLAIFWVGWKGFVFLRTVPKDAMLVKVTARMEEKQIRENPMARTTDLLKKVFGAVQ